MINPASLGNKRKPEGDENGYRLLLMTMGRESAMINISYEKENETMNTSAKSTQIESHVRHPTPGLAAKVGQFLWHLVQMILAMEAGMMVYHLLLWPLLAQTRYGTLTKAYPLFGYWIMLVSMVLGMLALMCIHRFNWRYILEMTIAMLAPLAALTVLVLCYVLPIHTLFGMGDPVMILAMTAFMLFRPHEHAHSGYEQACH
jgi:hypothetical protein